jgi:hypothetical protein
LREDKEKAEVEIKKEKKTLSVDKKGICTCFLTVVL